MGTVTFAANSPTATVTIDPTADTTVEPDETVSLTLVAGTGYTIGTTTAITRTIQNDDFPALSIQDAAIREGNSGSKNLTFTVSLSQASPQSISVNFATVSPTSQGHTATPNFDYTPTSGTLTIAAGQLTGQINVPIIGDTLDENSETFVVNLSNAMGATLLDGQGIGTIEQDDTSTAPLVLRGGTVQIAYVAYYGRSGGLGFWNDEQCH